MDVDIPSADATAMEASLSALLGVMESLQAGPTNLPLLREQLRLARECEMQEQVSKGLEMLAGATGCDAVQWAEILGNIKGELVAGVEAQRIESVLELLTRACNDYLSISNLRTITEILIQNSDLIPPSLDEQSSKEVPPAQAWAGILSEEQARRGLKEAVKMADFDIAKSHLVWDVYRDWELAMLAQKQGDSWAEALKDMHKVYVNRLATVHSTHEATSQAYSTFNSTHSPDAYEANMVSATKARTKANVRWEARDIWEQGYQAILDTPAGSISEDDLRNQKIAYLYAYLEMELNTDAGKKVEGKMVQGMFERILAVLSGWGSPEAKLAEVAMWEKYGSFMATTNGFSRVQVTQVWQRAARCCSGSGKLWSRLIRNQELNEVDPSVIGESYMRALALGDLTAARSVKGKQKETEASAIELVDLELAWAGYLRSMRVGQDVEMDADGESDDPIGASLRSALERCKIVDARGDPEMRLERYLISWLERQGKPDEGLDVFESLTKYHGKSCQFWLDYTRFTINHKKLDKTRSIFKSIAGKPNLDWPESAWEAWITFEEQYGTAITVEAARNKVLSLQDSLAKKRAREAAAAQRRGAHAVAQIQPPAAVDPPTTSASVTQQMQVDPAAENDDSLKRKLEEDPAVAHPLTGGKKARFAEPEAGQGLSVPYKPSDNAPARDREHCTVTVTGLRKGTSEKAVQMRFSDCGNIREVTVTELGNQTVAAVEFESIESIPGALTKDKKIIDDVRINVYVAWNSTLYVTNFPERADDAYIRDLFKIHGEIFSTRWPSKKFSSTRRFVYVQYVDPASAQAALQLHHKELEPGRILNVLISDPDHKKERSDAQADACELFIGSLSKFVVEKDLRRVFEPFGAIKRIKVVEDADGQCKGFAFLEYETELSATNALSLDKTELKKRQMSVVKASTGKASVKERSQKGPAKPDRDKAFSHAASRNRNADILSRSLRLKDLPKRTQEGLLQQMIEKIAPVRSVEIFQSTNEAAVELTNVTDMGKFLLRAEPLLFDGVAIIVEVETDLSGHSTIPAAIATAAVAPSIPEAALLAPPPRRSGAQKKRLGTGARSAAPFASTANATPIPLAASATAAGESKGQEDFRKMLLSGKR